MGSQRIQHGWTGRPRFTASTMIDTIKIVPKQPQPS